MAPGRRPRAHRCRRGRPALLQGAGRAARKIAARSAVIGSFVSRCCLVVPMLTHPRARPQVRRPVLPCPPAHPLPSLHPARARRLARLACRGRRDPSVLLAHVAPGSPIRHSEGAHEGRGGLAQHRHLNILKTKIVAPLKKKEHMFLSRSSLPPCVTYQDLGLRS